MRPGQLTRQPAHIPHVLLVVHGMNNRACPQKEQRLEKGMGEQVENRAAKGTNPRRKHHVTKLRAGRIGNHPLDIKLR